MRECRCSRLVRDGFLCVVCVGTLRALLGRVDGMLRELGVTAARQDRVAAPGPRASSSGRPLPVNLVAVDAAVTLALAAGSWQPKDAGMIGAQEWGPGYLEQLEGAMHNATEIVDLPKELIHLGACGNVFNDVACEQELFVPEGDASVHCECCGTTWDVRGRRAEKISTAWNVLAPARTVVKALASQGVHITPKHLENWAALWHVAPVCDLKSRRVVYRVADVYAVAQRMAARRRPRRVS